MQTQSLPINSIFKMSRLLQTELGAWRDCSFTSCIHTKTCTGGPRGTCLKTGGWPICTEEGRERARIADRHKIWPGENAPENETISGRAMRRLTEMLTRMTLQAKLENTIAEHEQEKKKHEKIPNTGPKPPWKTP